MRLSAAPRVFNIDPMNRICKYEQQRRRFSAPAKRLLPHKGAAGGRKNRKAAPPFYLWPRVTTRKSFFFAFKFVNLNTFQTIYDILKGSEYDKEVFGLHDLSSNSEIKWKMIAYVISAPNGI